MSKVNNYILTGPPRSGTTLTCFLLNKLDNTIALHEPMNLKMFSDREAALSNTASFFESMRSSALAKGKIISKVKQGKIPDNPFANTKGGGRKSQVKRAEIAVGKALTDDFNLLIKHNGHFTFLLEALIPVFSCFAIIRNPLAMIASWNTITAPVSRGNLTVLKGINPSLFSILDNEPDLIDRQIMLADMLFRAYSSLPKTHIIKYENIISSGGTALSAIVPQAQALDEPLMNKNSNKIYDNKLIQKIGARLLDSDGAFWKYYRQSDIEKML